MNKRIGLVVTGLAVAVVLGGGTALGAVSSASIPDSSGVIHGCYNARGTLKVIDTSVTSSCPNGYSSLNWNQAGPPGPATAGPGGLDVVTVEKSNNGGLLVVLCPADHPYVIGGGGSLFMPSDGQALSLSAPTGEPPTPGGWQVQAGDLEAVNAVAICAK